MPGECSKSEGGPVWLPQASEYLGNFYALEGHKNGSPENHK